MKNKYIANKELADELAKRFMFIEKAHQQILVGNYGIAKDLLGKVLIKELTIKVVDKIEEPDETAE